MKNDRQLSELHPELFHYTNFDGLSGILRSQSLWGTHWKYLNDANELAQFAEFLPSVLRPARANCFDEFSKEREDFKAWAESNGGIEKLLEEEVQGLVRVFKESIVSPEPKGQFFEFYVTSFCTPEGSFEEVREHGLLSMWRYYGFGGYALVFDTAELEYLMSLEAEKWPSRLELGDVGYSCDSRELLESRIPALRELREIFGRRSLNTSESFEAMLAPLLSSFIHYKHWAFAEEREVRLSTILNGEQMRTVHADEGTTWRERERHIQCDAPRIHLFEGLGQRLPIKRIIVGPGEEQSFCESQLRALLGELRLDIPVALSSIPLR